MIRFSFSSYFPSFLSYNIKSSNVIQKLSNHTLKKSCKVNKIKAIRGMHDILQNDFRIQKFIIDKGRTVSNKFGFEQISTPIIEDKSLFLRAIGSDSDVVSKELFTINHISNDIALRPEGTSGILRSVISPSSINYQLSSEKTMNVSTSQKLFYAGSMFRHERPQKGRYREFTQLGVEWIGENVSNTNCDIQILSMASNFLNELQISSKLRINTIGNENERINYRKVLQKYFEENDSELSEHSKERLKRGSILRILDSKDICDKELIKNAPNILDYLDSSSIDKLKRVEEGLSALDIPYFIDSTLVRGLDYYNDIIFEFCKSNSKELGESQSTILAGGRYDKLSSLLGGKDIPAVGWAAGVDRLSLILNQDIIPPNNRPISIIVVKENNLKVDNDLEIAGLQIAHKLRLKFNTSFLFDMDGSIGKQFKRANKNNSLAAIVIGKSEVDGNFVTVKWLDDSIEEKMSLEELSKSLQKII